MTDPATTVDDARESLASGVELEYEPLPGGKLRLAVFHQGTPVHSTKQNTKILGSDQLRRTFINTVIDALEAKETDNTDAVETSLREWFAAMNELDREEQKDKLLPDETKRIIDGTQYPVEVYGGETTTWHVTLTLDGRTRELEFTASEMVSGGGATLKEKIANEFYKFVDIEQADWEAIRERWQEHKEVVDVVNESASDAIADRVLEHLGHRIMLVDDREKLANSSSAAWYDPENTPMADVAPPDAAIVWVQDSFLVDQLETAGKSPEYKGQLIKTLNQRGDLYGAPDESRQRWPNAQGRERQKFYAFDPDVLGVDEDDAGGHDDPNHSEVGA
jgi:hypothetical protein